jgi:hypothetical protein
MKIDCDRQKGPWYVCQRPVKYSALAELFPVQLQDEKRTPSAGSLTEILSGDLAEVNRFVAKDFELFKVSYCAVDFVLRLTTRATCIILSLAFARDWLIPLFRTEKPIGRPSIPWNHTPPRWSPSPSFLIDR